MTRRKVAVIGLDSITPVMIEPFLAEGRMPNLQRLQQRGWWSEITPTMPPTTPAGWATVATGAWPSTHGIEGFAVHCPGDPLDRRVHACTASRVKAEFIWQTAERHGLDTILLKYPMSWPPTEGRRLTQVDGAGGWGGLKCVWDMVHSGCWDTEGTPAKNQQVESVDEQQWMTRDQDNLDDETVQALPVRPAGAWVNLPAGVEPLWETQMLLRHAGIAEGATLHLLAAKTPNGDRVLIALSWDAAQAVVVGQGEWSDWIRLTLSTPEGERSGHVRLKVMLFDAAARRLRLYQTQVHQESGYTRPQALAADLLQAAGPFAEWTESYDRLQNWIDDETQLEVYEQHVRWMGRAARFLLQQQPWNLFMTQVHFVDMAYHLYWGAIDPKHPGHDPATAKSYWDLLGRVHTLADQFLGEVLSALDSDTLVVVTGDHGHDLFHTSFMINHILVREGLLALYRDRRTGQAHIDWSRSRAYAIGYRIFLNVAGRDPQGIVPPQQIAALRDRIIQLLYAAVDPRTGEHPVRMAVTREDSEAIGLYGNSMGDVIFAMAPGYQARSSIQLSVDAWIGPRLRQDSIAVYRPAEMFREFSGEHDTSLPFTRAIRSLTFMHGPGVRNTRRQTPVRMVDIAPTICHYLGIPNPAQCEGSPIWDAFETQPEAEATTAYVSDPFAVTGKAAPAA